jgi:hypothetical protein
MPPSRRSAVHTSNRPAYWLHIQPMALLSVARSAGEKRIVGKGGGVRVKGDAHGQKQWRLGKGELLSSGPVFSTTFESSG